MGRLLIVTYIAMLMIYIIMWQYSQLNKLRAERMERERIDNIEEVVLND
jgi:hypothetical protein